MQIIRVIGERYDLHYPNVGLEKHRVHFTGKLWHSVMH